MQQRLRASSEFRRGLVRIRFKLTAALAPGGSAAAHIVRRAADTGELVDTTTEVSVHDAFSVLSGAPGDYGYALWWTDGRETNGGRFEIIALTPSGNALLRLDADLDAGTFADPSSAAATLFLFNESSGDYEASESITVHNVDGQVYLNGMITHATNNRGRWEITPETIILWGTLDEALVADGNATASINGSTIKVEVYDHGLIASGKQIPSAAQIDFYYHRGDKKWYVLTASECQEDQ